MNGTLVALLDKISENLALYLILEARIAATLGTIFFLRREWIPARLVLIIYVILGIYMLHSSIPLPDREVSNFYQIFIEMLCQCLLGITTALIINFFVEFFIGFGQLVSMQSGLGFVNFFVPRIGSITPLSHFFMLLAIVIFFGLNGHLIVIKMLINSMRAIPAVPHSFKPQLLWDSVNFAAIIFQGTLMLSIAIILSLMLSNITLGFLTKFAPQLNIITIGINISLMVAFFIIYISFDVMIENGNVLFNELISFLERIHQ